MTGDLWALFAALILASVQLSIASILTLRQLGEGGSLAHVIRRKR